jgi:hypothetical protein
MKNISYSPKIGDETEIEDVTGYGSVGLDFLRITLFSQLF